MDQADPRALNGIWENVGNFRLVLYSFSRLAIFQAAGQRKGSASHDTFNYVRSSFTGRTTLTDHTLHSVPSASVSHQQIHSSGWVAHLPFHV
jgi:hypothetical protein